MFVWTRIEWILYAKRGFTRILIASLLTDFHGFDYAKISIKKKLLGVIKFWNNFAANLLGLFATLVPLIFLGCLFNLIRIFMKDEQTILVYYSTIQELVVSYPS